MSRRRLDCSGDFCVRKKDENTSNFLKKLSIKTEKLKEHIRKNYPNHTKLNRILTRFKCKNNVCKIEECAYQYTGQAAYSINKGDKIGICLHHNDQTLFDTKENTLMFVYLHELAHIMSVNYAHDEEFWNNFGLLVKVSVEAGIYTYVDYSKHPTSYCGHDITHNPGKFYI